MPLKNTDSVFISGFYNLAAYSLTLMLINK